MIYYLFFFSLLYYKTPVDFFLKVRQLKTKITRAESKDRRRSLSLKGRDSLGLGKDVDLKLTQLEARIEQLMPSIDAGEDASPVCFSLYITCFYLIF